MQLKVIPVTEREFKQAIRGGRVISQRDDHTLFRVGRDLYAMIRDSVAPGGWFRGVDRGHYDRDVVIMPTSGSGEVVP